MAATVMSFESVFDESYERVLQREIDGMDFFAGFYHRFLNTPHPMLDQIREKFRHTDMEKQRGMLKKSFYSLLVFYASNHVDDYLLKTARMHDQHHLNIPPEFYDIWLDSLVTTVRDYDEVCLDAHFSDEIELAWRLVLSPGITYMKFFYDHDLTCASSKV